MVVRHDIVAHLGKGEFIEDFPCAFGLDFLNTPQVQTGQAALGLCNEVEVFDCSVIEGNGPVRGVVADRGRDEEAIAPLGEFRIDTDLGGGLKVSGKPSFNTVLRSTIHKDVGLDALLHLFRLGQRAFCTGSREDGTLELLLGLVI